MWFDGTHGLSVAPTSQRSLFPTYRCAARTQFVPEKLCVMMERFGRVTRSATRIGGPRYAVSRHMSSGSVQRAQITARIRIERKTLAAVNQ
jgi:hypothetical protein